MNCLPCFLGTVVVRYLSRAQTTLGQAFELITALVVNYEATVKHEVTLLAFQGLVDYVMAQLPQNDVFENALRHKVKLLPDEAMRDLIANALIHQDLTLTGMYPTVEIYSNRIEITNPGSPLCRSNASSTAISRGTSALPT